MRESRPPHGKNSDGEPSKGPQMSDVIIQALEKVENSGKTHTKEI